MNIPKTVNTAAASILALEMRRVSASKSATLRKGIIYSDTDTKADQKI